MKNSSKWNRSFGSYTNAELRALKFHSRKEINRAVDLIWSDPELKGVPLGSPDGITLIVPKEAVRLFKARMLKFKVSELVNHTVTR